MKSMKGALGRSIKTEEQALEARFEKADALFEAKPPPPAAPERVIRDSFTLPAADYQLIGELRTRCLRLATNATKSELIRAGLHALQQMPNDELLKLIQNLPKVKIGRPTHTI
jgi:hypothetical protein